MVIQVVGEPTASLFSQNLLCFPVWPQSSRLSDDSRMSRSSRLDLQPVRGSVLVLFWFCPGVVFCPLTVSRGADDCSSKHFTWNQSNQLAACWDGRGHIIWSLAWVLVLVLLWFEYWSAAIFLTDLWLLHFLSPVLLHFLRPVGSQRSVQKPWLVFQWLPGQ